MENTLFFGVIRSTASLTSGCQAHRFALIRWITWKMTITGKSYEKMAVEASLNRDESVSVALRWNEPWLFDFFGIATNAAEPWLLGANGQQAV
jgi:hypothetical protein